jgi:probable rRNA maturation factor
MTDGGPERAGDLDLSVLVEDGRWDVVLAGGRPALEDLAAVAVSAALAGAGEAEAALSLAVVLADDARVAALNAAYRGREGPTNVLSFAVRDAAPDVAPAPGLEELGPEELGPEELGDVILALETCRREAGDLGTDLRSHLCHLIVHGVLHLLGYDHQDDEQAEEMEGLETEILAGLGIADPYAASGPAGGRAAEMSSRPLDER